MANSRHLVMTNKKLDTLWVVVSKDISGLESSVYMAESRALARSLRSSVQYLANDAVGKNVVKFSVRKFKLEKEKK